MDFEVEIIQSGQVYEVDLTAPTLSVDIVQAGEVVEHDQTAPMFEVDVLQSGAVVDVWLIAGPQGPAGGPPGPQGPAGPAGAAGSTGPAGPANSLAIGTVTTGTAGSSAAANITGTPPAQTLSLTIPRGDKGDKGDTGNTGATGPANSLSIGTVTTGAAGSSAAASITGTPPTQTLSLTIPRGDTGATGSTGGTGPTGPAGPGVPTGGTSGQVLKKNSGTDYDTGWLTLGTAATKDTGTGANQIPVLSGTPGSPDGTKFLRDDGTWAAASGGSGGGGLLAYTQRTATSNSTYTISTPTNADVDAANLAVTFTAPSSGSVVVNLYGASGLVATSGAPRLYWSLRTGTTNVAGTERLVQSANASSTTPIAHLSASMRLTGLTSGTSYTYKWAWRATNGNTATLYYGNGTTTAGEFGSATTNNGALVMEVWSA